MKKHLVLVFFLNLISSFLIVLCWDYFNHRSTNGIYNSSASNYINKFPLNTEIPDSVKKRIQIILKNGAKINFSQFPIGQEGTIEEEEAFLKGYRETLSSTFIDLDSDNIPELYTQFNWGGAQGIDEYGIFIKENDSLFKQIYLSTEYTEVKVGYIETICNAMYFNTCGGCSLDSTFSSEGDKIKLIYHDKMFKYCQPDESLNVQLKIKMNKIKMKGIPQGSGYDDGTRRAFAANSISFFFNNKGDYIATKQFFEKYYTNDDKEKIWQDILIYIEAYKNCQIIAV